MSKVMVRTPATTANFGPGFDCVGIALQLFLEVEAEWEGTLVLPDIPLSDWLADNSRFTVVGEGGAELNQGGLRLFYKALAKVLGFAKMAPKNLQVTMNNSIPLSRGLGSSAACIVAAMCLGQEIAREGLVDIALSDVAELAVKLEGHPDNVLPALYGGACLSFSAGGHLRKSAFPIPEELFFVVVAPDLRVSTAQARTVLPQTIPLTVAVENSSLLGALLLALRERDYTILGDLLQGPLHVPYRSELIPGYADVEKAAFEAGALAFTISGSGPSVLAICTERPDEIGKTMVSAFQHVAGVSSYLFISKVQPTGTRVLRKDD